MALAGYRFRFYPTLAQRRQLATEFGCARYVYNRALRESSQAYHECGEFISTVELSRRMTVWKQTDAPFLTHAASTVLIQSLWDLDTAYQNFFEMRAKYPKPKKRHGRQSVTYQLDQRYIAKTFKDGELLKLPKLGSVEIVWSREVKSPPKMVTVTREPDGRWYVSFAAETEFKALPQSDKAVGIDLGVKDLATFSDGRKVKPPRYFKRIKRILARRQRAVSCKHPKGSHGSPLRGSARSSNYRKSVCRAARIHSRIADQRRDFLHKLSISTVCESQAIAIEDLNVRGVMANGKLASAVGDASWSELRRQLTYKAERYGRKLIVVGRFEPTSKKCSCCGHVLEGKLPLGVRSWQCPVYGETHDRDINAARNILAAGLAKYREEHGNISLGTGTANLRIAGPPATIGAGMSQETRCMPN